MLMFAQGNVCTRAATGKWLKKRGLAWARCPVLGRGGAGAASGWSRFFQFCCKEGGGRPLRAPCDVADLDKRAQLQAVPEAPGHGPDKSGMNSLVRI
jgi:hypothetical protein